jgi:CubicO group peptidase (beta-lactamase class C family)
VLSDESELVKAAILGDLTVIEREIADGADRAACDEVFGLTPFQLATIYGRHEVAEVLKRAGAVPPAPPPPAGETLDRYLHYHFKPGHPGAVVLVAKDGEVRYTRAIGSADVEKKTPLTPQSILPIGSVTKQFTATAILLLAERGELNLDDTIHRFLPAFPHGDRITLRHLLTHTSGIKDFTRFQDFQKLVGDREFSKKTLIERIAREQPAFEPGTNWDYSNSGYLLLGEIAEQVSGKPYLDFLKDQVLDAVGMQFTNAHDPERPQDTLAAGYVGDQRVDSADQLRVAGGSGELSSTAGDLFRWNEAIFNGRVLKPKSLAEALTPQRIKSDSPIAEVGWKYGMGWIIDEMRGLKRCSHSGGLDGYSTHLIRFVDQNMTIAVLTNGGALSSSKIASVASHLFLWESMDPQACFRHDESLSAADLDEYVGSYVMEGFGTLAIKSDGEALSSRLAEQPWNRMITLSRGHFSLPDLGAEFHFERDDDGKVVSVRLEQRGIKIVGRKQDTK